MITYEQLRDAIDEEVKDNKGLVYKPPGDSKICVYVHGSKPSCLIGRALFRLGVPLETLRTFDDRQDSGIESLVCAGKIDMDNNAMFYATNVQSRQDQGTYPWATCVSEARAQMPTFMNRSSDG